MARSITTNYDARFLCDSVKMAVFKSVTAAKVHGASLYDVRFEFATAASPPDV